MSVEPHMRLHTHTHVRTELMVFTILSERANRITHVAVLPKWFIAHNTHTHTLHQVREYIAHIKYRRGTVFGTAVPVNRTFNIAIVSATPLFVLKLLPTSVFVARPPRPLFTVLIHPPTAQDATHVRNLSSVRCSAERSVVTWSFCVSTFARGSAAR